MRSRGLHRALIGLAVLGVICMLGLGYSARLVIDPPARLWLPTKAHPDVALVLSGDPDEQRTRAAARLFLQKRVGRLVISGAGYGGDSAKVLAQTAYELGVEPDSVLLEIQAQNTFENLKFSLKLLKVRGVKVDQLLIVTGQTHMARAGLVAEKLAPHLQIWVLPVPEPVVYQAVLREAVALWVYGWQGRLDLW